MLLFRLEVKGLAHHLLGDFAGGLVIGGILDLGVYLLINGVQVDESGAGGLNIPLDGGKIPLQQGGTHPVIKAVGIQMPLSDPHMDHDAVVPYLVRGLVQAGLDIGGGLIDNGPDIIPVDVYLGLNIDIVLGIQGAGIGLIDLVLVPLAAIFIGLFHRLSGIDGKAGIVRSECQLPVRQTHHQGVGVVAAGE